MSVEWTGTVREEGVGRVDKSGKEGEGDVKSLR